MKKLIYTAAALALLTGCNTYKSFKTPDAPTAQVVGPEVVTDTGTAPLPSWHEVFTDPALQTLIRMGLTQNADLRVACLNIDQAQAQLLASKLAYLPSLALSPEGSISRADGTTTTTYNLPLTAQWEIDLSSRLRNSKEQARAALLQSTEYARLVQTQLVAAIANTYYTLLMLDEQASITRRFIVNQQECLDGIIALKEAGLQNETAVNQAEANLYSTRLSAQDLDTQVRMTENTLSLLLNQGPQRVERGAMASDMNLDVIRIDPSAPVSLAALAHRPDVKEAEMALRRNFYATNVARSAFYPSLVLGGSAGWTNNLGAIVNPGQLLLSAIGSLTQPLFSRGQNRANLKIAKAQYEQSMIGFEKTLLTAGSEVNDALLKCQNSTAKQELRRKQVQANANAYTNSRELMANTSTTYLEVLTAQSGLLQAQLLQAADWMEGVQGRIGLYKALGGGE